MKDKQEQIEEMAKCMGEKNFLCADDCENCIQIPCKCKLVKQSKLLYKAGYRKASDVIDEFVDRIKELLHKHEYRSQTDGIEFYQMNAESFCNEINELAAEMRKEVEE